MKQFAIPMLMIGLLAAAPLAFADDTPGMSDMQHHKTMGGSMHHPEKAAEAAKDKAERAPAGMSDMQHHKTMGGSMHHPKVDE